MKRTTLSPRDAAWLANTFARNNDRFGGWSMEATSDDKGGDDKPDGDNPSGAGPDDAKQDKGEDKPLGENGEKALRAERDARKALETQLSDLKKGLLGALGGDASDDKEDPSDALVRIQQRLDEMQHQNAVLAVANEHRITNEDDLKLLGTIKDAEAMKKLAERLAPAEEERDAKSRRPKPDRSQGGGGSDSAAGGKSVKQVMDERRAAREAKATSST